MILELPTPVRAWHAASKESTSGVGAPPWLQRAKKRRRLGALKLWSLGAYALQGFALRTKTHVFELLLIQARLTRPLEAS